MRDNRPALFISHANPSDNSFTIWLGAKLASMGYEVWADVLRLKGGDDWQRKLEKALRERACKVLLVANPAAVEKQGVRNEIQIATDVAKAIGDDRFIIPLRLAAYDAPFLIAHAQYIDFSKSWSKGLLELLDTLESTYKVPRTPSEGQDVWREIQLIHAKEIISKPETLISNWLPIDGLPSHVRMYDFAPGISIGQSKAKMGSAPWPLVTYNRGFISFAPIHDLQYHFGPDMTLLQLGEKPTEAFIASGWVEYGIEFWVARNQFGDLARQALDKMFRSLQLASFEFADGRFAWWVSAGSPNGAISFKWGAVSGRRKLQGVSNKRKVHWHYGVTANARVVPLNHVRIIGRLIFTSDGLKTLDTARMHRLRRSFAKAWRNARWRDMMLAYLYRVANGRDELIVLTSADEGIALKLPPMAFASPISVADFVLEEGDDDDPSDDEEVDEFEEFDGEMGPEEDE